MSAPDSIRLDADDRFDRLRRIPWWNQDRLHKAKVLVLGAGALGNEILKNLALMGVGHIFIADKDKVEPSNLSRSVLFRERDSGQPKAVVAAAAVRDIYPEVHVQSFVGDVIYELGLGVYLWADIIIGGLDNREARLWINRYSWKAGKPWVDGATEVFQGVARVFVPPDGPCFECTMSEADWDVLEERRGCDKLRREGLPEVRIPTTSITASIIAALECQEAVKLLYSMEGLSGKGLVFDGLLNETYVIRYNANPDCNSHVLIDEVIPLAQSVRSVRVAEIVEKAVADLGPGAVVELNQEILTGFYCPRCAQTEQVFRPLGAVAESAAVCPRCSKLRRAEKVLSLSGSEAFAAQTLAEIGVPLFDLVIARKGLKWVAYQFLEDAPTVMGALWENTLKTGAAP